MPLILKRNLKLLGGSLATVNPPPPPPVYAPGEERSAKIFHHNQTRNHPKQLISNSPNYEARLTDRSRLSTPSAARAHDINSPRTETSIFDLQNDPTVRQTVTTFVWPQTQFRENLHTNFVLQNLPTVLQFVLCCELNGV